MASKFCVFACLTCGEFIRSTIVDSIEQLEMHMCCELNEKRQNLLKLRGVIDEEIAKVAAPKPPPLPAQTSSMQTRPAPPLPFQMSSTLLSQNKPQGSLKEQLNQVSLKKQSQELKPARKAGLLAQVQNLHDLHFGHKGGNLGNENDSNMANLQDELKMVLKKRAKRNHPYQHT